MMQFPTRTYRCGYNLVLMCSYDGLDRGTVTTVLVKYSNGLYLRRIIQRINCKPPPPPLHITLCFFLCFCVLVCYNTGPVFFYTIVRPAGTPTRDDAKRVCFPTSLLHILVLFISWLCNFLKSIYTTSHCDRTHKRYVH